jgi:hypothetical protein
MHKRNDKFIRNFGPETLKRRKHWGDIGVSKRLGVHAFD